MQSGLRQSRPRDWTPSGKHLCGVRSWIPLGLCWWSFAVPGNPTQSGTRGIGHLFRLSQPKRNQTTRLGSWTGIRERCPSYDCSGCRGTWCTTTNNVSPAPHHACATKRWWWWCLLRQPQGPQQPLCTLKIIHGPCEKYSTQLNLNPKLARIGCPCEKS